MTVSDCGELEKRGGTLPSLQSNISLPSSQSPFFNSCQWNNMEGGGGYWFRATVVNSDAPWRHFAADSVAAEAWRRYPVAHKHRQRPAVSPAGCRWRLPPRGSQAAHSSALKAYSRRRGQQAAGMKHYPRTPNNLPRTLSYRCQRRHTMSFNFPTQGFWNSSRSPPSCQCSH